MDPTHPLADLVMKTCLVVNLQESIDKFVEELPILLEKYRRERIDHPENNLYEFALMKYISFTIDVISGLETRNKILTDTVEYAKEGLQSLPAPEESASSKKKNISTRNREILNKWLEDHKENPYPTLEDKQKLVEETGLSIRQVKDWFINARRRYLPKPSPGK